MADFNDPEPMVWMNQDMIMVYTPRYQLGENRLSD